ncbi:MAG: hypothetical protein WCE79_01835 [Xanthobacteraceae bacterium]
MTAETQRTCDSIEKRARYSRAQKTQANCQTSDGRHPNRRRGADGQSGREANADPTAAYSDRTRDGASRERRRRHRQADSAEDRSEAFPNSHAEGLSARGFVSGDVHAFRRMAHGGKPFTDRLPGGARRRGFHAQSKSAKSLCYSLSECRWT